MISFTLVCQLGIDETTSGYMFSAELGVYALVAVLAGKLSDKLPTKRFTMIIFGLSLQGLGLSIVGPSVIFNAISIPIAK